MDIITPKSALFVDNNTYLPKDSLVGIHRIVRVGTTKLTCCCEFMNWIVCGGFSGELFFVKKLIVDNIFPISNSIIRCVVPFNDSLLVTTDAGQIILFNGEKITYSINTDSPIYSILVIDDTTIISGERTGAIKEWKCISNQIVFNRILMFAEGCIFSLALIDDELIAVGAEGKKYVFEINKERFFYRIIAPCNIFCIAQGTDPVAYYGLSNGQIICEKKNERRIIGSHQDAVRDIAFSPAKQWMFSVSKDNTIKAWHNEVPCILAMGKDYLYQVIVTKNFICYVDGHGDLGRIDFEDDIDRAKKITIISE